MTHFLFKNSLMNMLIALVILSSAWSILLTTHRLPLVIDASNQPDAYMETITAVILNKQGTPSLKITAPKMMHYAEHDTTQIIQPHVIVYRHSPEPWHIQSDFAKTTKGTEQIIFSQNVVIHHPSDIADPTTTLKTASLTVLPEQQRAETQEAVTITQPDTIVHAIGMLANLNEGTIKLLSQAQGDYTAHD